MDTVEEKRRNAAREALNKKRGYSNLQLHTLEEFESRGFSVVCKTCGREFWAGKAWCNSRAVDFTKFAFPLRDKSIKDSVIIIQCFCPNCIGVGYGAYY